MTVRSSRKLYVGLLGLTVLLLLPTAGGARGQEECVKRLPPERISLRFREEDIKTTLRTLGRQYRVNLLVTDEVTGTVTLDFFEIPVRDAFQAILDSGDLDCVEQDGVLRVSTAARVRQEEEARFRAEQDRKQLEAETRKVLIETQRQEFELAQAEARGPLRETTIRLSYADAEEVAKTLQGILGIPPQGLMAPPVPPPALYAPQPPIEIDESQAPPAPPPPVPGLEALGKGLTIMPHKPTNSIFIRYYANDLERIVKLVKEELDIPLPQVEIAAQVVVITKNALEQLGIQWGGAVASDTGHGTLLGAGFTQPPQETGTPVEGFTPDNSGLTLNEALPVNPATGLPTGGNLVNLPLSTLPVLANPAFGLLFGIIGQNFNFNLAVQALEVQGKARSLSEPKVVTIENSTATMLRGFEVPFQTQTATGGALVPNVQFKDAVLRLEVTPTVIREDTETKIKMKVIVENNEPDFARAILTGGNPPLFKRRAETEVIVREGQQLVIGGVLLETDSRAKRQVPLLSRIPILGWLFKNREISSEGEELIVIITPTVVDSTNGAER
ncbi:MAG: secretin N-terminal domain-containing protein [Anaerolineae bacterium]